MGLFSKSESLSDNDYKRAREEMVARQLAGRDVGNADVLDAMRRIPRHLFVPEHLRREAYHDCPLPIDCGQTISQPYVVGSMTEHLNPSKDKTVLEIGTGSGYQAAVLAEVFASVDTVEYFIDLSNSARRILESLGYSNIAFHIGDGLTVPGPGHTFDAIIVTAAPEQFPETLIERLNPGGRLVVPVGGSVQYLELVIKDADGEITRQTLYGVRFVPLQGDY